MWTRAFRWIACHQEKMVPVHMNASTLPSYQQTEKKQQMDYKSM